MQTFTAREYLKIDIANSFGLDKKKWSERIAWFDQNQHQLHSLLNQADEPALFFAGVSAWEDVEAGKPIGYPISLDATSSGMQILAALTGDRSAAETCNVVNYNVEGVPERRDGYTVIYKAMLRVLGEQSKITREDTKRAIMTSLYGSQAVPKEVFGEGLLLKIFLDTMCHLAPAAWELNQAFLDMWNPNALSHDWTLPDNFHVHVKVMNQVKETVHFLNEPVEVFYNVNAPTAEGRSLGANTIHSVDGMIVREMVRRCNYDPTTVALVREVIADERAEPNKTEIPDEDTAMVKTLWKHYKKSGYLSVRIIDHLHPMNIQFVDLDVVEELLNSLPEKPFQVISVHDCFRCLPQYGNDLRRQYNNQLMLIAKSNLLQFLISQILGRQVAIGKLDSGLWKDIAETEYALS